MEDQEIWLVRHGETEWSRDGRHTSRTDLPLTPKGEADAARIGAQLSTIGFEVVRTSPRRRAARTAALAGFADAVVDHDLVEWDYGDYEGLTTKDIRESVPGWTVWSHPSPGGETAEELGTRLDGVIARLRAGGSRSLVFGHSHALRALAARWIDLPVAGGARLRLDTASVSVLGYERETPVILRWNT